ncbi:uncharacterized protein AB675_8561 [Cyphellophora attinorum]|uniref:Uncharacterized protein n=1 Tax=Cyphellophora attinorum TaxID=1664694 RepID=A0A0N1HGI3_9EURO|nr:uncharacterized protein AB675_8561 [Phialophora attinorum]KPI44717.1 hypothetical protein AB675_8561 [Phialophora attinorum]
MAAYHYNESFAEWTHDLDDFIRSGYGYVANHEQAEALLAGQSNPSHISGAASTSGEPAMSEADAWTLYTATYDTGYGQLPSIENVQEHGTVMVPSQNNPAIDSVATRTEPPSEAHQSLIPRPIQRQPMPLELMLRSIGAAANLPSRAVSKYVASSSIDQLAAQLGNIKLSVETKENPQEEIALVKVKYEDFLAKTLGQLSLDSGFLPRIDPVFSYDNHYGELEVFANRRTHATTQAAADASNFVMMLMMRERFDLCDLVYTIEKCCADLQVDAACFHQLVFDMKNESWMKQQYLNLGGAFFNKLHHSALTGIAEALDIQKNLVFLCNWIPEVDDSKERAERGWQHVHESLISYVQEATSKYTLKTEVRGPY